MNKNLNKIKPFLWISLLIILFTSCASRSVHVPFKEVNDFKNILSLHPIEIKKGNGLNTVSEDALRYTQILLKKNSIKVQAGATFDLSITLSEKILPNNLDGKNSLSAFLEFKRRGSNEPLIYSTVARDIKSSFSSTVTVYILLEQVCKEFMEALKDAEKMSK
ncbi:MAG: hypothetical protein DRP58_05825 [Spirochaetes bacterium]|nr:MAG: hypothetical protein DRP58_05825 [Spirochaetota bacterium]